MLSYPSSPALIRHSQNEWGPGDEYRPAKHAWIVWKDKMASSPKNSSKSSKESVILTENDIPGARISHETVEECSVVQLRRWLLCRGAKTSGTKPALIARVNSYIASGLDKRYLRDPDGGVNVQRKKALLGVLNEHEPEISTSFPKEGFKCDIGGIPNVTFGTIWRFLIDSVDAKKQISTAKPLVKGYNFYKSGHVLFISHLRENGKHFLKSKVLPSMKKKAVYSCCFVLSSVGNILRGYCGCPAGVDGRCNHVAATLFALEEFCKVRTKKDTESCTSKPCKWNVPRKRSGTVVPISQMSFMKHDYAKKSKKRRTCPPTDRTEAPIIASKSWPEAKAQKMLDLVKAYQESTNKVMGWSHVLLHKVPEGSVENATDPPCQESTLKLISPVKEHPVSLNEIRERCEKVKKKLQLDESGITELEKETRGQSMKTSWFNARKYRITASKCHRVATMKDSTSPTKAIQEVLKLNTPYQSRQMKEGIKMEKSILQCYKQLMTEKGHVGINVSECGFFVSKDNGILGGSPDGIVEDPSVPDSKGLVEVKFIQVNDSESLKEALTRKRICKEEDGALALNHKHQYYFQVQQQMYVCKRNWTDFVVQGSQSNDIFCERIMFSRQFWESILPKLERFFNEWVAPEIAYPKLSFGQSKLDIRSF